MSLPNRRFEVGFSPQNAQMDVEFSGYNQSFGINFGQVQRISVNDYEELRNKPSINGVELVGDQTTESLNIDPLPGGGTNGDVLMKDGDSAAWVTPASRAEQDNTRPITAAAVYTEIGNINALLATI